MYYNNEELQLELELELIEIYEDRRLQLQTVTYLLRLSVIILIISGITAGISVALKIINLF